MIKRVQLKALAKFIYRLLEVLLSEALVGFLLQLLLLRYIPPRLLVSNVIRVFIECLSDVLLSSFDAGSAVHECLSSPVNELRVLDEQVLHLA